VPEVSLVVAAKNEGDNLVDMLSCLFETDSPYRFEIVLVDDGSADGSGERAARLFGDRPDFLRCRTKGLGVAAARNRGAGMARGDKLIFLDGHCWCPPGWMEALLAPLEDAGVGLVGPAFTDLVKDDAGVGCGVYWPKPDLRMQWLPRQADRSYAVPLMPGGCDAIRRELFEALSGYDAGMGRWGSEGEELSLRVWSSGREVHVAPDCLIRHLFRTQHPYRVNAVEVLHNRLRMAWVHFPDSRLQRVLNDNRNEPGFAEALARVRAGDAMERRARRDPARIGHVESWFGRFVSDW
jgi:glycosyltransferase involved in cell wall biosynthesis